SVTAIFWCPAEVGIRSLAASGVQPSAIPILPLGTPPPGATGVTKALKATSCPLTDGLADGINVVTVEAGLIVCVIAALLDRNERSEERRVGKEGGTACGVALDRTRGREQTAM